MTLVERDSTPDLSGFSLEELAEYIGLEYEESQDRARKAAGEITAGVIHGIRAGEALLEAKSRHAGQSDWVTWLEANAPMGRNQAHHFMRWAHYKDEILSMKDVPITTHNIRQLLGGLPMIPRITDTRTVQDEKREEIKELVSAGVPVMEVARRVGVHRSTVSRITNPDYERRSKERQVRQKRRRAEERRALERQQKDAAARKVGGDLSVAYSLVRKLAAALDSAMTEHEAQRGAIRIALSSAHRAEDHISQAIREAS